MSILSAIRRFFDGASTTLNGSGYNYRAQTATRLEPVELAPRALYDLLKSCYLTNGTYDDLRAAWSSIGYVSPNLKAIRNVVAPVVDVLGSKLYPEPLVVTTPATQGVTGQQEREQLEAADPLKAGVEQVLRIWRTDGDATTRALWDLGPPEDEIPLAAFGIDFVPIVRTPFREIDDGRAIGAVQLALEAIVEADLSATNLHAMVYSDAEGAWVLKAVGLDANNRPLPPPVVGPASADGTAGRQSDGSVQVGKRSFWRLGGNQELQSVIPDIDYAGALAILQDHDTHLERLMPALSYVKLSELSGGDLSGKAITYKMRAFVDQVEEGRANVLASLKQADMMALTMGQAAGIFAGLGSFDAGDFEHSFSEQPILHISSLDESEELRTKAQAAQALATAGVPLGEILMVTLDKTETEAAEIIGAKAEEIERMTPDELRSGESDDTDFE